MGGSLAYVLSTTVHHRSAILTIRSRRFSQGYSVLWYICMSVGLSPSQYDFLAEDVLEGSQHSCSHFLLHTRTEGGNQLCNDRRWGREGRWYSGETGNM